MPFPLIIPVRRTVQLLENPYHEERLRRNSGSDNWNQWHDATVGTGANDTADPQTLRLDDSVTLNMWGDRLGFTFDLSTVPVSAKRITAATISLYITVSTESNEASHTTHGNAKIVVCDFSPASDDNFVNGDFDGFGVVDWSDRIEIETITDNQYTAWTLNAAGLAAMEAAWGGIWACGMRISRDIDDDDEGFCVERIDFDNGNSGTNKAKLEFTYRS
jgi:hypothetical protein